jgi:hypothetical protein
VAAADEGGRKSRRLGAFAWTAIVAATALGSSLVALVFELWPGLKPDPRTKLGADVSVFAVDPRVSYGAFLQRLSFSDADLRSRISAACGTPKPCGRLNLPGEEAYVQTTVEGFKRRSVALRLSLYNAASQTRVAGASDVDVAKERLAAPSDQSVIPVWIVCPPKRGGRYFIRVELYHSGDHVLLAVADSRRFSANC